MLQKKLHKETDREGEWAKKKSLLTSITVSQTGACEVTKSFGGYIEKNNACASAFSNKSKSLLIFPNGPINRHAIAWIAELHCSKYTNLYPVLENQHVLENQPRIRMLAAVQALLAKLLAWLPTVVSHMQSFGPPDVEKHTETYKETTSSKWCKYDENNFAMGFTRVFFWVIRLSTGKTCIRKTDTVNRKGLGAPYMTSYRVAKTGKPPTVVNSSCFRNYDWDDAGKKAKNTVPQTLFHHPSVTHTLLRLQASEFFALQLDESTHIARHWTIDVLWTIDALNYWFFFFFPTWMKLIMD